jgi:hypothetical protein
MNIITKQWTVKQHYKHKNKYWHPTKNIEVAWRAPSGLSGPRRRPRVLFSTPSFRGFSIDASSQAWWFLNPSRAAFSRENRQTHYDTIHNKKKKSNNKRNLQTKHNIQITISKQHGGPLRGPWFWCNAPFIRRGSVSIQFRQAWWFLNQPRAACTRENRQEQYE